MANFYLSFRKWQKRNEKEKTKQQIKKRTTKNNLAYNKTRVSAYIHTHENTK